jgi:uncharacterized protein DUF6186
MIGWWVLAAGFALCWGLSYAGHRLPTRVARPSDVLGRLVAVPALRVAVVLAWMWAGWHLFAR